MAYDFCDVMKATAEYIKAENISGTVFAESCFYNMITRPEQYEESIMGWAERNLNTKKKTWGEVLSEIGLLNRNQMNDVVVLHTVNELELRKEVPDDILASITTFLIERKE